MHLPAEIKNSIPFQYAYDVRSGKIITGRYIQLAVDRFFKLIEAADQKGVWLDHSKGMKVIRFFEKTLIHTKGKSAGKPFILSPYQQFTLYNIFAWQTTNEDGQTIRLIRNIYEKVAKKNGKTAVMAGLGLYMMALDGEAGAEIYSGATKKDQAKLSWQQAVDFVKASSLLQELYKPKQSTIQAVVDGNIIGEFKPLEKNAESQDGINSYLSIIDEYHAHPSDALKENLESSSAARLQPITYTITTAGTNLHGVCKNFEDSCINILEGVAEDDTFLIMIHNMDDGDDWEDPANWIKCNPNLGITVSMDFLLKEYNKAKNQPSKIPNFKTKNLNMWVDGASTWIPAEYWDQCMQPIQEENFEKYGNCGALDLSSTTDLTAYAMISNPDEQGCRDLKVWCFAPKDTIERRSKEDRVPYRYWADLQRENATDPADTFLIATPGNMVDYREIEKVVIQQYFDHKTKHVEYDRKFSAGLVTNLMEANVELSPFTQTIGEYTSPTKEFMRLVMSGKLRVGSNPILKWMLSGCVAISDTNENIRIDKSRSTKRIDGIIASIMALAGTMGVEEQPEVSKYNDPDVEYHFG